MARELVPNVAERKAYLRAKRWYEWLALLIADWQKHHGGVPRTLPQDSAEGGHAVLIGGHELVQLVTLHTEVHPLLLPIVLLAKETKGKY